MSKWISVKDRLPKDGQRVLVTQVGIEGHDISQYLDRVWIADYQKDSKKFWIDGGLFAIMEVHAVVNWMPLPEPPIEGKRK